MRKLTLEDIKSLGGVILLPDADSFQKALGDIDNSAYTRVYFNGIRIMFGNLDWLKYANHLACEKALLDDTEDGMRSNRSG